MSKPQLAEEERLKDAGDASEAEAKGPESGMRPAAPEAGTQQAESVRTALERIMGVSEIPSPDEVMRKVEAIERGSNENKELSGLVHVICQKPMQYVRKMSVAQDGSPGWHCQPIKRDTERITVAQSQALANAINDRIDPEIMKRKAETNRRRNERKTGAEAVAQSKAELYKETLVAVEGVNSMNELNDIAFFCKRHELLNVDTSGKHWEVKGIEGNKESYRLAQAINAKRKRLLKVIGHEKEVIGELLRQIEYCPNLIELGKIAWTLANPHNRNYCYLIKRFTGNRETDWVVEPVSGRRGARELAEAIRTRYEELMPEHQQENIASARSELAEITGERESKRKEERRKKERKGKGKRR